MESIAENIFIQLGAVGLMLAVVLYFFKILFFQQIKQLEEKETALEQVQRQYIEHLTDTEAQLILIIEANTKAFERLAKSLEKLTEM